MPKLPKPTTAVHIPPGTYKVVIKKLEFGTSKNKGTPQIRWSAEILEGDLAGKPIFDTTYLGESSLWRVSNLLASAGLVFPENVDTNSPYFDLLCKCSVGRSMYWTTVDETVEDKVVYRVKRYFPDEDLAPLEVKDETAAPSWAE